MKNIKLVFVFLFLFFASDQICPSVAPVFAQADQFSTSTDLTAVSTKIQVSPLLSIEKPLVVPHAGGAVENVVGTNSLDALNESYLSGFRAMELDFNWTSDGSLALIHDWEQLDKFCPALPKNNVPTSDEFEEIKIMGKYDSLTIKSLAAWLAENPDVFIITDIKKDNVRALGYIRDNYPDTAARMIPQIYTYEEYQPVRDLGYRNIILTLYAMTYVEKTNAKKVVRFAKDHPLYAVTIDKTLLPEIDLKTYLKSDVTLYAHTVNDSSEAGQLTESGVFGVYSDSLPVQATPIQK